MKEEDWNGIRIGDFLINTRLWALRWYFPDDTGVDAWVYISSRQRSSIPFIIMTLQHPLLKSLQQDAIIISIGKKPRILWQKGKFIEPKIWQQIVLWIQLNRRALELLWYDKISEVTFWKDFLIKI